jgi:branched-chain amino acid transport system permease protein
MIETILQGLLLGGLYCLFALGQSLMFGVMRLTNTAHGDFIILAAFAAIALLGVAPAGLRGGMVAPLLALVVLLPFAFLFGYALQRFVLNGTLGHDPLPSLVVTFGLAIVIQNLLQQIFSADPRAIESGGLNTASLAVGGGVSLGVLPLLVLAVSIAATAGLQRLLGHTQLGRAFRAVSDDLETAELMGLSAARINALATAIAFMLVSLAGVLQALRTTVSPADGPQLLLFAFEAVIIGGMGSFWGTFTGAMLLGITQQIGFRLDPGWGIWAGHVMFLIVMVMRPQGLFPRTRN